MIEGACRALARAVGLRAVASEAPAPPEPAQQPASPPRRSSRTKLAPGDARPGSKRARSPTPGPARHSCPGSRAPGAEEPPVAPHAVVAPPLAAAHRAVRALVAQGGQALATFDPHRCCLQRRHATAGRSCFLRSWNTSQVIPYSSYLSPGGGGEAHAWLMHGSCLAHAWLMHGSCLAHAWLMHGSLAIRNTQACANQRALLGKALETIINEHNHSPVLPCAGSGSLIARCKPLLPRSSSQAPPQAQLTDARTPRGLEARASK